MHSINRVPLGKIIVSINFAVFPVLYKICRCGFNVNGLFYNGCEWFVLQRVRRARNRLPFTPSPGSPLVTALSAPFSRYRLHVLRPCLCFHGLQSSLCKDYCKICMRLAVMRGLHLKILQNHAINTPKSVFYLVSGL